MYRQNKMPSTTIRINKSFEGETIEQKVRRILQNKEQIKDTVPLIYTTRQDGINAKYDPRADRWDIATEARDYITKSHIAKRDDANRKIGEEAKKGMDKEINTAGEPIQPTDNK